MPCLEIGFAKRTLSGDAASPASLPRSSPEGRGRPQTRKDPARDRRAGAAADDERIEQRRRLGTLGRPACDRTRRQRRRPWLRPAALPAREGTRTPTVEAPVSVRCGDLLDRVRARPLALAAVVARRSAVRLRLAPPDTRAASTAAPAPKVAARHLLPSPRNCARHHDTARCRACLTHPTQRRTFQLQQSG